MYGRFAYLTNAGKMVVLDINDPANPKVAGTFAAPGLPHDYYVEDGLVYAPWIFDGLYIIGDLDDARRANQPLDGDAFYGRSVHHKVHWGVDVRTAMRAE